MLELDHFAITTTRLEDGVAEVEEALGLCLDAGGQHPHFGTHNRLLGLGDIYMEVIAIDPSAAPLPYPRWFDIDHFDGPTRLTNWILQTPDLAAALSELPDDVGQPVALARGDLRWSMAVPETGKLPCDGAFPALIAWQGGMHPSQKLPDRGCRLTGLEIAHPDIALVQAALKGRLDDPRVSLVQGTEKRLTAEIETPHGLRILT